MLFALVLGGTLGGLTLAIERLSVLSDNPIVGLAQRALFTLLLPGVLGSATVSGNAHAWYLWTAVAINSLVYFGLGWIICRLINAFLEKWRKV